jgi:hypothetical protein
MKYSWLCGFFLLLYFVVVVAIEIERERESFIIVSKYIDFRILIHNITQIT